MSGAAEAHGFLAGPAPDPKKTVIDFKAAGLTEYDCLYAVVLDGILTPDECNTLVRLAEQSSLNPQQPWERAMVNVGGGMQVMAEESRKCGRIIWDDQLVVDQIYERIKHLIPELEQLENKPDVTGEGPAKRREVWKYSRCNERMRFLKYTAGEYFKPHQDGMYETPDGRERTYYTLHLYLNESTPSAPLTGGATTFHSIRSDDIKLDVQPRMGSILIFQQRWLYHAGSHVFDGTKLTMRTELMYEMSDEVGPEVDAGVIKQAEVKKGKMKGMKQKIGWMRERLKKIEVDWEGTD